MASKPTVLPKPTAIKPNSTDSTTESNTEPNLTGSTTKPRPTVLPKPTTQSNSSGSETKLVLPSNSTVAQTRMVFIANSNLLTKSTDYSKTVGDAFIEMPGIHPAIAEINREFLLKIQALQEKEVQMLKRTTLPNSTSFTTKLITQPNATDSATKPTTQSNSTGALTKLAAKSNSTGSTTKSSTQPNSTGSTATPTTQPNSTGSTTILTTQPNSTGSTATTTTQPNSNGSTAATTQPNSAGLTTKPTTQSHVTDSATKPTTQPNTTSTMTKLAANLNSTGSTTIATAQPNSTGSTNKPATQPNSTCTMKKLATRSNSTSGSTTKPAVISNSTVPQIKLILPTNSDIFISTSSKTIAGDAFIEMPIVHSAIAELNPEFLWKIQALQSKEVQIHIEVDQSTVTLRGNRNAVHEAKQHILELLSEDRLVQKNINHIKSTRGIKDYLLLLSQSDLGLPCYWPNSACPDLSTLKFNYCLLMKGSPAHNAVTAFTLNTWNPSLVGFGPAGQNTKGFTHSNIVIKGIWIIENPLLYTSYQFKLKALAVKAAHKPFSTLPDLQGEPNVMTRQIAGAEYLNSRLIKEVNEVYLFHGSSKVHEIAKYGIDCRLAGDQVLFGRGAYFAESSTKSDQYAGRRRSCKDERLFMFVARVLLGEPFIAREVRPDLKKAPCSNQDFKKDNFKADLPLCDSVIGTHIDSNTRLLFREFIVYHPDQSYPEFLVEYERE